MSNGTTGAATSNGKQDEQERGHHEELDRDHEADGVDGVGHGRAAPG